LHFAVGVPDFPVVPAAEAVEALFPAAAGVDVSPAGPPVDFAIVLLLAGAVFDEVGAAAVAAALPAAAGVDVSPAGPPVDFAIALLLAGAVFDEVGAAAVAAALPAAAGVDVLTAGVPVVAALLLTPPWWLQAPCPALEEEPSLQATVAAEASCACRGATASTLKPTIRHSEIRSKGMFRMGISLGGGCSRKL
jgi:hypothetical protein